MPPSGDFAASESSARASTLTLGWDGLWPGYPPIGHVFRTSHPDRWVRFHSLPGSKRLAETAGERAEILRRHEAVLAELTDSPLVAIGRDWDARDGAAGWTRTLMPHAWPWRHLGDDYFWVASIDDPTALLHAAADDRADVILTDESLAWLYYPYDGGADVIARTTADRDALRARHHDWLSALDSGL